MTSTVKSDGIRRLIGASFQVTIPAKDYTTGSIDISDVLGQYNYVGIETLEIYGANYYMGILGYVNIDNDKLYYSVGNRHTAELTLNFRPHFIVQYPKN